MSAHTPGPWSVYDDFYAEIDGVRIRRLEIIARGKTVARIYTSVPEQDTPNARLIGAAPELLEALIECLECEFAVTDKAAIKKASAAIAKAKGEA